ncbi:MAG: hybrid sensor histidine kinase/response regulator [Desulfuromonas sp.]|nr:MAG: hybrid sensor histidine kinase/response regulator [Desulfuromonas sp.]
MAMKEKILVVDYERVILELTSMILRTRGFEVLCASSAEEGLELVAKERPALVLLDYMMPQMDGMTALRLMRKTYPDTYVIMFTGKGSEEIAVELMRGGASDYILKPFNNQDLVDRIENVLRIRRIELHNKELRLEREKLLREIENWNLELERRVAEKSRELESAHAEILQSEKLATLGHLSAGMAHEIRNPLNSIGLFVQLLKSSELPEVERQGYFDKIFKEVERVDAILVKLLAASKRPRYELQAVQIDEVAEAILDQFSERLQNQKITLEKEIAHDLPFLNADASEIEQIFTNLLTNSLQAMPQGGLLRLNIMTEENHLRLVISDNGPGIPIENQNKVFDPFFTTKSKGTGFGLSVVLRIVKTYGGKIELLSDQGIGTEFIVTLPVNG